MNRKSLVAAALLLVVAAPTAQAANAPSVISPVTAILGSLPVLGPTAANVISVVSGVVSPVQYRTQPLVA